jgi:hypothetical protein
LEELKMAFKDNMTIDEFFAVAKEAESDEVFRNTGCVRIGRPLPVTVLGKIGASRNEMQFFGDLQCHGTTCVSAANPGYIAMQDKQGFLSVVYAKADGGAVGIKAAGLVPAEEIEKIQRVAQKYCLPVYKIK